MWIISISLFLLSINLNVHGTTTAPPTTTTPTPVSHYKIGVGRADITGPAAEQIMMGYAQPSQSTAGIHIRLFARTFIIESPSSGSRVVYVNADLGMIDQLVKTKVIEKLRSKYGDLYSTENVMISGTHTHSSPGGFLQYILYSISTEGFNHNNFNTIVDGIVRSIDRAHGSMFNGNIEMIRSVVNDASINRSPTAYAANSAEERARYEDNVDTEMTLLKFSDIDGRLRGVLTWFAVHGTSLNHTNQLISGDNKGVASIALELELNKGSLAGESSIVVAFAASNLGDVSPNTRGPHCQSTGDICDVEHSTCGGKSQDCIASGPGENMYESNEIIARKQVNVALNMINSSKSVTLDGAVRYIHQHVDMSAVEVIVNRTSIVSTCKAALGYSFAAGTTDGPGFFNFEQGTKTSNPFWNIVSSLLSKPSEELKKCQQPKPILLAVGQATLPYKWIPDIVPTQLFTIGKLVIIGVPGEFTTMAGRRLRRAVANVVGGEAVAVISGLSNAYSSYVTTFEEYQVQRYEGASTLYGPHTHAAYVQQYRQLAVALVNGTTVPAGPTPPDLLSKQISLKPGVVFDSAPLGKHFGQCITKPAATYNVGDTVVVKFVAGHLANDFHTESSFLHVIRVDGGPEVVVANDASLETLLRWRRVNSILGTSEVTVEWTIPATIDKGLYKIRHFGAKKSLLRKISRYQGDCDVFRVI